MGIATVFAAPGQVTLVAAAVVAVLMTGLWLVSIRLRDVLNVDPVWRPAFVMVAIVAAVAGDGDAARRWLLLGLTAVWGLRLGGHLLIRKLHEPKEDHRYTTMRESEGARFVRWSLLWIFGLQGLLVLIVSLPVEVAAAALGLTPFATSQAGET
jgi:steroid 5-alpha reductase family enzyme